MEYAQPPQVEQIIVVNTKTPQRASREDVKRNVRSAYGQVAEANNTQSCCGNGRSCCGVSAKVDEAYLKELGYSQEELSTLPEGACMGLGCGNPHAISALKEGECVLDLGSGGGIDVFLASKKVGQKGRVFGVDMTPEMISKSRESAKKHGYHNVEFLLGEIEHLPLPNQCIDLVVSNCVVNLSTDKQLVFNEVHRVLRSGGRLAISDIVAYKPLPEEMKNNPNLHCNCIGGAATIGELKAMLAEAGFEEIAIIPNKESRQYIKDWVPGSDAENFVVSASIQAKKP